MPSLYSPEECKNREQSLLAEFGKNKIIPRSIQLPVLVALSHFPELKNIRIRFKCKKSQHAFASRPDWKTMWKKKKNREYLIILSTHSSKVPEELLYHMLPFNALTGIIGHELSHTVFYLNKDLTAIISVGIKYLNSKYRIKLENETDRETIRRGLGWQLLEFARFCRNHPAKASSHGSINITSLLTGSLT